MMMVSGQQLAHNNIANLCTTTDFAHTVFNGMPGYAIVAGDCNGKIIAYNEGARQLYGYTAEEVIGEYGLELFFPEEFVRAGKLRRLFARLMAKGRISYEGTRVAKDGKVFPAQVMFAKTTNRANQACGFVEIVQDMTKRKRYEANIEALNRELETTFNSINDAVSIHDTSYRLVRVNRAFADRYGGTPEQLTGRTCYEVTHGTRKPVPGCPHRQVLKTGKPATLEFYDPNVDAYLQTSVSPIFDDDGNITSTVHLTRDITERKRIEQRWWDSMSNFHKLVNNSADGMIIITKEGTMLFANPAAERLFGRTKAALQGSKFEYPIELCKTVEIKIPRDEGETAIAEMSVVETVWFDEPAYLASIRDITNRKRAEERLAESEKLYSTMANSSPVGMFIIVDGRFVFVNPHFCKVSGYSEEELLGADALSLVHPDDRALVRENAIKMLKEPATTGYRYRVRNKSGEERIIFEIITPIRYRSKRASLGIHGDITEQEQHHQALERLSNQLKAKVKELETFSYGIAHDLRSPLVSIDGLSQLLREDLEAGDSEKVQEDIRLLESSVRKMHDFLNSTLEYSRAGQLVKRTPNVSFGSIAREVAGDQQSTLELLKGSITVARSFPRVSADKIRLKQVLDNLLRNSIKYHDESRPLEIEVGHRQADGETVFFVRDNGLGIARGEAGKVFDLFYRGTSASKGSGVGLAVVKSIIEAHGGRIWIESEPGQGTTVSFTLPEPVVNRTEAKNG
jgi:PAS domain S-box-containing protein